MTDATPRWRSAAVLATVVALGAALITGIQRLGAERIAEQALAAREDALRAVLPAMPPGTAMSEDAIAVRAPRWLGSDEPLTLYRARAGGALQGWVLEAVAPDGYNGAIRLLIGVQGDGRIGGVRVLDHAETPGLGDPIHQDRSRWIDGFNDRRLGDPPPAAWDVEKFRGQFDQFAGATLSPRAVVRAVARALALIDRHGDRLAASPAGSAIQLDDGPELSP